MLAPNAEAQYPRQYPLQHRQRCQQAYRSWCPSDLPGQRSADHSAMDGALYCLNDLDRELAPLLHTRQERVSVTSPIAMGPARMFAAATASCTARLMPTPPTGDIA